jgi:hypothetical protein
MDWDAVQKSARKLAIWMTPERIAQVRLAQERLALDPTGPEATALMLIGIDTVQKRPTHPSPAALRPHHPEPGPTPPVARLPSTPALGYERDGMLDLLRPEVEACRQALFPGTDGGPPFPALPRARGRRAQFAAVAEAFQQADTWITACLQAQPERSPHERAEGEALLAWAETLAFAAGRLWGREFQTIDFYRDRFVWLAPDPRALDRFRRGGSPDVLTWRRARLVSTQTPEGEGAWADTLASGPAGGRGGTRACPSGGSGGPARTGRNGPGSSSGSGPATS